MTVTLNMLSGAMDVDEEGQFQELRTAGVRLRRVNETRLVLETAQGDRLNITSHFRVDVVREQKPGGEG